MLRIESFVQRRRPIVLGAWLALLLLAVPFALRQSDHLTGGGFTTPGSQSDRVQHVLNRDFGAAGRSQLAVALVPSAGATPAQLAAAVTRAESAIARTAHAALPGGADASARAAAARGGTVLLPVSLSVSLDRSTDVASKLRSHLHVSGGARDGVAPHVVGQGGLWAGMQDLSKKDLAAAEGAGFPIVLLILLAVFGSLAAAALPLALGVGSVMVTGALIYLLSQTMEMSVFVTNMASMIGIGVAVDYSLFVLARYREEILAGADQAQARATALGTSGVAVLFSGMTVIVSLAGLWMIDNAAIRSMALGAMLVVAVSVIASATLLPALIGLLGTRVSARGRVFSIVALAARTRRRRRPGSTVPGADPAPGFWLRWTRAVTRRPAVSAAAAAGVLLVLAIPALSISTSTGALRQFPQGNETRAGFEAAARVTGPGASSPADVVVRFSSGTARGAANAGVLARLRSAVAHDPAVARIAGVAPSRDGSAALITAIPRADGEATATKHMVERLRRVLPPVAGGRAQVLVGGSTAAQRDFQSLITGSMWKILLFVLALCYVVLVVLLRSLVLPLKAVLVNLLSVGAAYGVLVAVFQWGWADGFLGFQSPGHLDVLTPPLVLAVVFGLSMDYEVFLLTRIRERYRAHGDTGRAVAEGLASSARTITSAALIMVSVFAVFVGTGVPSIKELGLGNAVAIGVDATLVRLVLVPAAMELLGDWNWWLPRRLARFMPRADFEQLREPALQSG